MSKFTRNQLKDLVKECLVEILSEGLSSTQTQSSRSDDMSNMMEERQPSRIAQASRKVPLPARSQSPALNSTVFSPNQSQARSSSTILRRSVGVNFIVLDMSSFSC